MGAVIHSSAVSGGGVAAPESHSSVPSPGWPWAAGSGSSA